MESSINWTDIDNISSECLLDSMVSKMFFFSGEHATLLHNHEIRIKQLNDEMEKKIKESLEANNHQKKEALVSKEKNLKEIDERFRRLVSEYNYRKERIIKGQRSGSEIEALVQFGSNSKIYSEAKRDRIYVDFEHIKRNDIDKVDLTAVRDFAEAFNNENIIFYPKKTMIKHARELWSYFQWLNEESRRVLEEIDYTLGQLSLSTREDKKTIENNYNQRIAALDNELKKNKKMITDSINILVGNENESFETLRTNLVNSFIISFEQEFPTGNIESYLEFHKDNLIQPNYYDPQRNYLISKEVGMSKVNIEDYMFHKDIELFLKNNYNCIIRDNHLRLPISFNYFEKKNLIFYFDAHDDDIVVSEIQYLACNILLTSHPTTVNFAFIDPLKSSNTFAPFNKFIENNNSSSKLISGGIATSSSDINDKLSVISEHIVHVVSSCLQSNETTIQEYNKAAGSNAEPYLFLLIMDFPSSFSHDNLLQLEKIIETGPRCGVFTLIFTSKNHLSIADDNTRKIFNNITEKSCCYQRNGDYYTSLFNSLIKFDINKMFSDKEIDAIVPIYKKAYDKAGRIIVDFDRIAITQDNRFKGISTEDINVPIGWIGVNNNQYFTLGGEGITHHALIVGNTGSGKTTLLHTLITNLLLKYTEEELFIYLLDFKHGVEFKCYGDYNLPCIKLVALESERKLGYEVLQQISFELKRRSEIFKNQNCENISAYKDKTGNTMPRILLIIDEYQVMFDSQSADYIVLESANMLQRILQQGRAFGINVILASQNMEAASGIGDSTYNLISVRIALMCSSNVASRVLNESANDVKQLKESGMAVYNHNAGDKQASTIFRVAMLSNEKRSEMLEIISSHYDIIGIKANTKIVDSSKKKKETQSIDYLSRFERIFPKRSDINRKKIVVPFGTDEEGDTVYCDLEKNNFASYIMGAAGSGKSVLLDDIIMGIMMNYHPDEAELWLVDFMKTGFAKYVNHCPPHIKNIILGGSEEIVFGFIDQLYKEMDYRKEIFSQKGWNDISEIPLDVYMPVIIVVIDEFAEMSQMISETRGSALEDNYVIKLENLLREGRKLGFKFLFASQSYSNGMNGLSPAAKDQIQMRMALKNTSSEIYDTLDLTASQKNEQIENYVTTLPPYKTLIKIYLVDSDGNYSIQIRRINNLKITSFEIEKYIDEYNLKTSETEYNYSRKIVNIFTGNTSKTYTSQLSLIKECDANLINNDEYDTDDIVLYSGSPQGFGKIKPILLHRDACENILMAGGELNAVANTLCSFVKECIRKGIRVTLWTDTRNIINRKFGKEIFSSCEMKKGVEKICEDVLRLKTPSHSTYEDDEVIIVLGLRNLYEEFELYEDQASINNVNMKKNMDSGLGFDQLESEWDLILGNPEKRDEVNKRLESNDTFINTDNTPHSFEEEQVYDARDDINKIMKMASKRGKHFIVYYNNESDYNSIRPDLRLFKHKILFAMNNDFQYVFNEKSLTKFDANELLYIGKTDRYKTNVFINDELPIDGHASVNGFTQF